MTFKGMHNSSETEFKKGQPSVFRGKKRPNITGENHYNWKGGLYNNKDYRNERQKELRHKQNISKRYNRGEHIGISYTKEYRKAYKQRYEALKKGAGELLIKTVQLVYEDNIKRFGTLTCYLCLKPVLFGKDHLEHKTPLSRGGTNEYNNLAVACQKCNNKKYNKTEEEYKKEIFSK